MSQLPKAEKLGYSVAEACAALSLGKTTLYAQIAAGRLAKARVGGRTIIPADSLKALLKSNGVATFAETTPSGARIADSTHLDRGEGCE